MGHFHRFTCLGKIARPRCALIKCHNDVGTDLSLDIHHRFRWKQMLGAIDMRLKHSTFFGNLPTIGKRKNLITTAIGKDWAIPSIELMQTSNFLQGVDTRPQIEVISISKDNVGIDVVLQLALMHSLYCSCGSNRHKDRRLNGSVRGFEFKLHTLLKSCAKIAESNAVFKRSFILLLQASRRWCCLILLYAGNCRFWWCLA